jgi:hypothetical protein
MTTLTSSALAIADARRELAHRVSGGIEVTLFWGARDNTTTIEVWQPSTGELLTFPVAHGHALDAFYHPFAHLPTVLEPVPATVR